MSEEVQVPPENPTQNGSQQQPENPSKSSQHIDQAGQAEGQGQEATNQNPPVSEPQNAQGEASQQEVQQIEPKKEKGPYDIDEADMTPRFVRGMQVLGYAYDDLQHKDRKAVIEIIKTRGNYKVNKDPLGNKINQELIDALSNHLENTRKQKIDAIRKERLYVPIPEKKQQSAVDQSRVQSSIAEKSIVLDRSIISMSNSILTKSLSPLELEFKLYDKIKKKERAEIHRAKKEEELLSKQIEYQHRQQELDERLEKHRQLKQRQKHMQTQQEQEMLKWLHNRSDAESSNFNQAKQVVEVLQKELKETLKQRQLLNPREKIEKVKSMNDLRVKELEELQDKREKNMVERIEKLQELSTKVDNEKHMRAFQDLQREIKGLLKQEKVQIRSEMLDEYHEFMKRQQQFDDSKRIKQVIKNKTLQEVEQAMYKKILECKQQQLDDKLEKFKSLQTQSLKVKSSSTVAFPKHSSANNFGYMKAEYERRIGYQEDLIKEIDRNDNIQARIRREEQIKQDIQMAKESKRAQSRDLEISKVASIVSDMKHLEHSNMASTKRKLATIKNQHQEIETKVIREIEERRQKQEQDRQLQEKLEYEKKKERLRKQIDAHKEQLRIEEKQKQQQEQQQS